MVINIIILTTKQMFFTNPDVIRSDLELVDDDLKETSDKFEIVHLHR